MCVICKQVKKKKNDLITYPTVMLLFDLKIQINILLCICFWGKINSCHLYINKLREICILGAFTRLLLYVY